MPKPKSKPADDPNKFRELGVTGLQRYATTGEIYEEFLPELRGVRGRKTYREMADNDSVVGAILYVIETLIRNVTWRVEGKDERLVDFVESCRNDMSHTWEDFVAEVLSMLTYGWSWHEIVYKRRLGDQPKPIPPAASAPAASRYNDGLIGWRKLPIRAQDTLYEWVFDVDGGIQAMTQQAPPNYPLMTMPIERSLLFRTTARKGSPEGRSMLRSAYRPWYIKKRIENIEAIGAERDLAGLPVGWLAPEIWDTYKDQLMKILKNVRRDEQEGLLLPLVRDEAGNKLLEFDLVNSGGSRQFNTTQIIERWNRAIAITCIADFILMGHERVGSLALASSKTAMFAQSLGAMLKGVAAVMNNYAVPRLLRLNGWAVRVEDTPQLVPGDLETPDLAELSAYVATLAGAGAPLFPDDQLEDYLRTAANLPPKPEEAVSKNWFPKRRWRSKR